MSISLQIYHRIPPWSRHIVASLRGYYLSYWRYDKATEKLVEEALERDYWSWQQWKDWQENRLAYVLHRAATKVPYYKQQWSERRRKGNKSSWEYLENWNVLEKKDLRERKFDFIAEDCNPKKMFRDNTSGTTGTSLDIWLTQDTVKQWYALFEARCRRWYGVSRNDRWAIIGGQLVTPFEQKQPPFWVWNAGLKQLYLSAYHLSPEMSKYYLDALVKYRVKYILGYSAAIYYLAQEAINLNYKDLTLKVAVTNAEPLYDYQRKVIESAFNCPVRETYGLAEIAASASECEQGNIHVWKDTGIIEVLPNTKDETGSGELICTGLVNADMPLIKYRVGDYGKLSDDKCNCGRTLPLLGGIDGRTDDILYSSDGRYCSHIHLVLGGNLPIFEAQIIQKSLERILVYYVPSKDFTKDALEILEDRICSRMGKIKVNFKEVSNIPRTAKGKFRAVICDLPPEETAGVKETI